ncbi:sugar ABC transporter permease [Streptomyces sp. NBC_00825]|uniref:carbohydrate ABC transporter permease n=1 Tax=unclassified Streptomyces TaxID=2593676 RepID=UPI0022529B68|nr:MULTISPECIES: sugar ABC transporter permease [unclassified Streptomyces]WTB58731.1 sugar ABC transporter permease [Streptomyces sp. NBC_00826]WTH88392.1 sugar ABC transporter permease [Streptomyces sp. NBC_00825]WTH97121.1 sugar ABC transporter permease [Streptomyces sp. NBC_00822]MCX4862612.1 sugar ABC transporter permease [Streptomyces sp. NBC_00906]MCX4893849.1 sugar ABC transporter permease [Streptomyces sp. NBC_00892]
MSLDQADPAALPAAGPPTRKTGRAAGGAAGRRGHDRRAGRWWTPWLFLAPALLLFLYFKFIPMVSALTMSFQDVQPYLGNRWVGTENYATVLQSDGFREAAWHTVVLAAGQTAGSMALGLALALLMEGQGRRLGFVRSAAFLPVVVPIAVVAELWRIMYHPTSDGMLNSVLGLMGFGPSGFINDPDSSMASIMVTGIWRGAPYDMMIFLAGLTSVDRGLYEAAKVDGASRLQRVWHVTVPGLRSVFSILFILAAIRGLRVFTEVFLLTNGGPDGSTEVVMTLIYKLGLEQNRLGVGAAGAVLLFVATLILTVVVHLLRRRESK